MHVTVSTLLIFAISALPLTASNRSNQMNPNNAAYWKSRGYSGRPGDWQRRTYGTYDNNRANQLNPNNAAYWKSRGYSGRPSDWRQRTYGTLDRGSSNQTSPSGTTRRSRRSRLYKSQKRMGYQRRKGRGGCEKATSDGINDIPEKTPPPVQARQDITIETTDGISFTIPSGCFYVKKPDGPLRLIVTQKRNRATITFFITPASTVNTDITVNSELIAQVSKLAGQHQENVGRLISFHVDEMEFLAFQAVCVSGKSFFKGETVHTKFIKFRIGQDIYTFFIWGPDGDYQKLLSYYQSMIDSIALKR